MAGQGESDALVAGRASVVMGFAARLKENAAKSFAEVWHAASHQLPLRTSPPAAAAG